jgi:predicted DNA-binding WGR domain protein
MDILPDPICIFRRDPSLNMARFYRVEIRKDLFGLTTVERIWGRIGGRGQSLLNSYPSIHSAEQAAFRLVQAKERRSYRRPS